MKTHLKNILGMAILGLTLVTTTVPTWAGSVSARGVSITNTPTQRSAIGSMAGARYSADFQQTIACKSHTLSAYSWTTCYATDSAGRSLLCGSGDGKFLEVVHAMTDSSLISFEVDLNGTSCRSIVVYQGSDMLK